MHVEILSHLQIIMGENHGIMLYTIREPNFVMLKKYFAVPPRIANSDLSPSLLS